MKKIVFALFVCLSTLSWSQNKTFSDQTIEKFAQAYIEIRNENMSFQLNKLTAIEKAGLSGDEFTDIHLKLLDSDKKNQLTKSEIDKYNLAKKNIENLKEDIQKNMERLIENQGLKVETYHAIAKASTQDKTLKEKIQKLIQ
ncbi:DUF4168 domain-containing protein [Psychroflexus sp. MBR-150]|jgi:hypothetical protein